MPWPRDEPDALSAKRRQLAEQERELAQRMSRLHQELRDGPSDSAPKAVEHPVWRLEEETSDNRAPELNSAKRRDLARQRRRDKIVFFLFIAVLAIVALIFLWVYQTHLHAAD